MSSDQNADPVSGLTKGGGLRFNNGKPRHGLLPPEWTDALAEVATKGAEKYVPRNWEKGMDPDFMIDSLNRHLNSFRKGERYDLGKNTVEDPGTGCHHLAHAAWNILALLSYDVRGMIPDEFFPKPLAHSTKDPQRNG